MGSGRDGTVPLYVILIAAERMQQQVHSTCPTRDTLQPPRFFASCHPQVARPRRTAEITIYIYVAHFYDGIFHIFFKFNAHLVKLPA